MLPGAVSCWLHFTYYFSDVALLNRHQFTYIQGSKHIHNSLQHIRKHYTQMEATAVVHLPTVHWLQMTIMTTGRTHQINQMPNWPLEAFYRIRGRSVVYIR